jgi:Predicted methyltransferases
MEMTKIHERVIRGNLTNILSIFDKEKISMKGESVIVLGGENNFKSNVKLTKKIKNEYLKKLSASDAAKLISLITDENKRDIYKSLIEN